MPPDRSVDFDFTKRGLLVFADKSVTAGNVCKQSSLPEPRASTFIPNLGVNEFNTIIQQMAKVRLLGSVNQALMSNHAKSCMIWSTVLFYILECDAT